MMREAVPVTRLQGALEPFLWRVRAAYLVERGRVAAQWALAAGCLAALALRLTERLDWLPVALLALIAGLLAALGLALLRLPDAAAAARAADSLGLKESVASALFAHRSGHPAAPLLVATAQRALGAVAPQALPVAPPLRRWRVAGLLAAAGGVVLLAPFPALPGAAGAAADRQALAQAQRAVEAIPINQPAAPEPLAQAVRAEMEAVRREVAQAASAEDAAKAMERAQHALAGLPKVDDYAASRATQQLSQTWQNDPALSQLAQALPSGDAEALNRALENLAAQTETVTPTELQRLQVAFQAGANAARDVPDLARSLRAAAAQLAGASQAADGARADAAGDAVRDLSEALSQTAGRAAGLRLAQGASAAVGSARASVGAVGGAAVAGSASAAGGAQSSGGGQGSGSGQGSGGGGEGNGSGQGSGSGQGNGSGQGSGSGQGNGSSQGGGGAGSGAGAGAGAGAGGGAAAPQPGGGNAGMTAGGGAAAPSNPAAGAYDPIYAPSRLGGEGGPDGQLSSAPNGASGDQVSLPESPTAPGGVRPYNQVYGEYEAAARQTLTRQPLPAPLETLVRGYFSALAPSEGR